MRYPWRKPATVAVHASFETGENWLSIREEIC
jgi:hypothetical protein